MDAPVDIGLKRSVKAYQKAHEDFIYDVWLSDRPTLKDQYKYDFEAYKDKLNPKKIDKEQLKKTKTRIDSEVEQIKKKFAHKGVR